MTFLGKKCHGIFYVYQIIDTPDCLTFWNYLFCCIYKEMLTMIAVVLVLLVVVYSGNGG